jgi:hypothetical protein
MSVLLLGDGTITSSIALTTLTLNNPSPLSCPREFVDNFELQRGDGGVIQLYKKGRRSLRMTLRISWITTILMDNLMKVLETVDQTNWFTLQDHTVYTKSNIAHETLTGQAEVIQNATAFQNWLFFAEGLTAFAMTGANQGQRRRINYQDYTSIKVSPVFSNNIAIGDTFLIGIPVFLTSPPKIESIRYSDAFRVELNFEEKIF